MAEDFQQFHEESELLATLRSPGVRCALVSPLVSVFNCGEVSHALLRNSARIIPRLMLVVILSEWEVDCRTTTSDLPMACCSVRSGTSA
jgi:hypothetical protein